MHDRFIPTDSVLEGVQECIMPLVRRVGSVVSPAGTGFMVAPGILMTAAHVIQEIASIGSAKNGGCSIDADVFAVYVSSEISSRTGTRMGGALPVKKAWVPSDLDIAFVHVSLPHWREGGVAIKTPCVRLSAEVPKIGEEITAVGYHKMSGRADEVEPGKFDVHLHQPAVLSRGRVTEVHMNYRDTAMLSFPCMRTDARFDGGMSGGPVFNSQGNVCGVVCSSMSDGIANDHISYVSLMWAAFGGSVDFVFTGEPVRCVSLFELAKRNIVAVDGSLQRMALTGDPAGRRTIAFQAAGGQAEGVGALKR